MKRNQTRTIRTEIIELAISKHSDNQLTYVGDTTNGCDFLDNNNVRYECKSREKMFGAKNGFTKEIILKNFYRKSVPITEKTFDHMIVIDTFNNSAGIVDYDTAIEYNNVTDSIITTRVPLDKINFLAQNIIPDNIINFELVLNNLILEHI